MRKGVAEVMKAFLSGVSYFKRGNVFISGGVVYSYGTHFPLVKRLESGLIVVNSDYYSVTTSSHCRDAMFYLTRRQQPFIRASGCDEANIHRDAAGFIKTTADKLLTARTNLLRYMDAMLNCYRIYCHDCRLLNETPKTIDSMFVPSDKLREKVNKHFLKLALDGRKFDPNPAIKLKILREEKNEQG